MSGTDLYVAARFGGGGASSQILKWAFGWWYPLGVYAIGGRVNALAVSGTDVYVGGQFYIVDDFGDFSFNVAKWNGSDWSGLSTGVGIAK